MLNTQARRLEDKTVDLRYQYSFLESQVNLHSQRLYVYDELNAIGLGLNKLRLLLNTIKEIAAENGINYKDGVDQFFEFIEKHYAIKLRLKKSRTTIVASSISPEYTARDSNSTTNNYPSNKPYYYYPVRLSEQQPKQQQDQTPSSISDNNNNDIISATENG
jgi:hypothetical protein